MRLEGTAEAMSRRFSPDDLAFAYLRARWFDGPRQVAADLLAAAANPEALDGVMAQKIRVKAAIILCDCGELNAGSTSCAMRCGSRSPAMITMLGSCSPWRSLRSARSRRRSG
jgi:hypothetical protein